MIEGYGNFSRYIALGRAGGLHLKVASFDAEEQPMSRVPNDLIAAYLGTEYRAHSDYADIVLRIGERSEELAGLYTQTGMSCAMFITAENPFSQPLKLEENAARQEELLADLAELGAIVLDGVGQGEDPSWPAETSFLALGLMRDQACEIGSKYEQNAIVWAGDDAVPKLALLR